MTFESGCVSRPAGDTPIKSMLAWPQPEASIKAAARIALGPADERVSFVDAENKYQAVSKQRAIMAVATVSPNLLAR